jgi:exonuclease III
MKLLAWNVMKGGAKRAAAIVETLETHSPDVAVLTEVRPSSAAMLSTLANRGWHCQLNAIDDNPIASVAIVARHPLQPLPAAKPAAILPGRWIEASVPDFGITIAGAYGPLDEEPYDDFWTAVCELLPARVSGQYVLAGDLNTGESRLDAPRDRFFCSHHFLALRTAGLVDVWRSRNPEERVFSYHHPLRGGVRGAGFRLDHLLMTSSLANRVVSCGYDLTVLDSRIPDHALVFAEVA